MMRMTRLSSGLTVVSDRMEHVDSAAIGVFVDAGARSEHEGEHGLAHFMEHMAFKGTGSRTARQISEAIESLGGDINAATSVENTTYHARVLTDDVPAALEILADIVSDPLFSADDIARERNVILQEIGAAEDMPEDRAFDAFPEAAFRAQPLGRRILGTRASVRVIDRGVLSAFLDRHYGAEALTVCVAGAIDHDAFVAKVDKAFSVMPARRAEKNVEARYTGGIHAEKSDGAETHVILGFEGEPAGGRPAAVAQVASMALGGGMSSRLFQALREDRGLVYDTSAFHWAFSETGAFAVHFATEPATMAEAFDVTLDELSAAAETLDDEECARAKAQLRAGLLMSRESCVSRMGQAARLATLYGRPVEKEERLQELDSITASDVRAALKRIWQSAPTLVTVGGNAKKLSTTLEQHVQAGVSLKGAA